ncbi:unnamed protein product [Trichogramma brassicae]|uniref:JmjC domain-containing protein n=1 Tax=Trichogramma brassicae TaxID=86971 RepID=A0A6H5I1Z6_9HYME|nr:unnamed protein product [Trichogramma brassicae]
MEEESLDYNTYCRDHKETSKRASSSKEAEKLTAVDPGLGGVTLKRRMFFLMVYHVLPEETYTILKVTQESTTKDVMLQALQKANISEDRLNEFILVEEVQQGWEKREREDLPTQRVLDPSEHPLQAQGQWKGQGRFLMKRVGHDPSSRAWLSSIRSTATCRSKLSENGSGSEQSSHIWAEADTFLVCVYNVSPQIPYTILRLPVTSASQDVVAQALVKARRMEDPKKFVLMEELEWGGGTNVWGSGNRQRRVLGDEENVYTTQAFWKTLGRFVMKEREPVMPKKHLLPATLNRLSKGFSVGRSVSLPGSSQAKLPVGEALSDPTTLPGWLGKVICAFYPLVHMGKFANYVANKIPTLVGLKFTSSILEEACEVMKVNKNLHVFLGNDQVNRRMRYWNAVVHNDKYQLLTGARVGTAGVQQGLKEIDAIQTMIGNVKMVILEPNDVLFIPNGWWHYVESLDISLSVNVWIPQPDDCKARLKESLVNLIVNTIGHDLPKAADHPDSSLLDSIKYFIVHQ